MWTAMRSDLMDFVSIIADDTSKTLNKVIGEHAEEDEEMTIRQQMTTDLRRSYNTYGTPVEEQHSAQYEKFLKKFSLSSQANDIAELLDAEVDVSRYYAELVPSQVKPEDFWARYFFRLLLLSKEGHINLDDDDDEELLWETNDAEKADKDDAKGTGCPDNNNAAANDELSAAKLHSKIASLETENMRLKGQVKTLAGRVTELEKELTRQEQTHVPSSKTIVPPKISATGNNSKVEIKEQSQPTDGTSLKTTGGSTNDSADQSAVAVAPDRSVRRSVLLEPLAVPYASSTSPFAADCANSPFKPITSSGSTSVTLMGTRQSVISNSATTLATESSINTGSVSPLTEVTEAFIRRAQRASQTATLSNINTSANVSICTSEQEQSSSYMNNNDFQSETASEDSGVLVVPEKGSTGAVKGVTESDSMEMSPLNANTAENLVSDGVVPSAAVENIATEGPGSIKVDTKSPAQLAALDGDEEEDDGWS